ncbi:murein hydrolase activator EnvC family protein [Microtetraspora niveoalba]|uniref:murein hydrolase activator EnvC family protein n=1 Tax=Microtetraspora niveoalba TaxID=46175 RepID=UPI001FDEB24B|nr:M23 family metallopeptidase [Microtetraspora niveoalba]
MQGPPRWQWPLSGHPVLVRRFQPPPQRWLAGHRGVDIGVLPGATVHAAGHGVIGYAGPLAGRGVVTVIHPGGLRTTYMPVRASVRPGQAVEGGSPLGIAEDLPGHCPVPCLHWGLLRGAVYLDPLLLLGLGQVRLLPTTAGRSDAQPWQHLTPLATGPPLTAGQNHGGNDRPNN